MFALDCPAPPGRIPTRPGLAVPRALAVAALAPPPAVAAAVAPVAPGDLSGPIPTLWASDGPRVALDGARELLAACRPPAVQVHTWRPDLVVPDLRRLLGDVPLVVGCGVDGIARTVALGQWSVERGTREFLALARRACDAGALAVCWNAEAAWKRLPSSLEGARLWALIPGMLAQVRERYPRLRQWHTSYDHPSYHATYPWRAWLGPGSPIEVSLPQVYAAPGGGLMAHRGALPAREARALSSWRAAIRAGWIAPDDPATAALEGVRWRPYLQCHHVPTADTVAVAVAHPLAALWAVPTRCDDAGRLALRALCELWRRGYWGADAVQRFQAAAGLRPDGVCGPRTLAALGLAP
jgi:hypothetical protein